MATPMAPACAALAEATGGERHGVAAAVLARRANDGDGVSFAERLDCHAGLTELRQES